MGARSRATRPLTKVPLPAGPELHGSVIEFLEGGQDRCVGSPDVVVTGLAESVVIEHAPAQARPAIVELPEEGAGAVRFAAPEVFDAEFEALDLGDHAVVDVLFENLR